MLYIPPGWGREHGDPGTATAVLTDAHGHVRGYLNATPRQGNESLATWDSFRVHHNAEEGDRDVRTEAAATDLPFPSGRGSCVKDRYRTISNAQYIELACLVSGGQDLGGDRRGGHARILLGTGAGAPARGLVLQRLSPPRPRCAATSWRARGG